MFRASLLDYKDKVSNQLLHRSY